MIDAALYGLHGLKVASAIPLAAPRTSGASDITIEWEQPRRLGTVHGTGELLAVLDHPSRQYRIWRVGSIVTVRFASSFEFVLDLDSSTIRVIPDVRAPSGLAAVLLGGSVLSAWLLLQGMSVLHASAITISDGAIALVGGSGSGKSTVAALLCARGCGLLGDDVIRAEVRPRDVPLVFPGLNAIRLRPKASGIGGSFPDVGRSPDGRTQVNLPVPSEPLPLRAMVFPRPLLEGDAALRPLSVSSALTELLRWPRLYGWRDATVLEGHLRTSAALARSIPAFVAELPWGPPFDDRTLEVLEPLISAHIQAS